MPLAKTWLLPDGVADVLPVQAQRIEQLRRLLLDRLATHGYELVFTPIVEYVESLLAAQNEDLDLATFKLIDQLSGRLMGVRADMTPQIARIDAHVRPVEGAARYCYAATVLHTRPQGLSNSRTPMQLGAELFGSTSFSADLEVLHLMLTTLHTAGLEQLHVDLGHVQIFHALSQLAQLNPVQQHDLFNIYQRKALPDLVEYTQQLALAGLSPEQAQALRTDFLTLGQVGTDLAQLKVKLSAHALEKPALQAALEQLTQAVESIKQRWPKVDVSIDAAELRGFHYHTGLVFAVYTPYVARPVAQGGRYDGIGTAFGRTRPATGFSCDLADLAGLLPKPSYRKILAPNGFNADLDLVIEHLRAQGDIVIQAFEDDMSPMSRNFTHRLVAQPDGWAVVSMQS